MNREELDDLAEPIAEATETPFSEVFGFMATLDAIGFSKKKIRERALDEFGGSDQ